MPAKPKAAETKAADEVLSIDKKSAYQEVSKSVAKKKAATPKQESLPFDFAQEPVADYSPPNPAKEGFIGGNATIGNDRSENAIDATISIADEHAIELEEKKDLLFDILKELLTNVVRHSQAKLCIVSLFRDEDEWVLQVEDDGVGLDETEKRQRPAQSDWPFPNSNAARLERRPSGYGACIAQWPDCSRPSTGLN